MATLYDDKLSKLREVSEHLDRIDFEESAKHQREVFLLLNALTDTVLVSDVEGTILFANPSTFRLLGYDPKHIVGKNICEILDCDDIDERIDTSLTTVAKNSQGVAIPIHMYIGSMRDGRVNLVVSVIRKI